MVRFCGCLPYLHLFACLLCFLSAYICPHLAPISLLHLFVVYQQSGIQSRHLIFGILVSLVWNIFRGHARSSQAGTAGNFTKPTRSSQQFAKEGYFFWHFFFFGHFFFASGSWLLAFGFWLLAFGFWLLGFLASGLYLLHFGANICNLHAICCSLEPICMPIWLLAFGFWLWLHLTLGFWFLFYVVFFLALVSLGFFVLAALLLNICVVL